MGGRNGESREADRTREGMKERIQKERGTERDREGQRKKVMWRHGGREGVGRVGRRIERDSG